MVVVGRGGSWVKKQHFRMLLVSDVTNVAGVWVDACELSLIDLFSLLERHVAGSPYICVTTTLPTELLKLSVLWGESKISKWNHQPNKCASKR